jgi:hypothetical protein
VVVSTVATVGYELFGCVVVCCTSKSAAAAAAKPSGTPLAGSAAKLTEGGLTEVGFFFSCLVLV